MIAVGIGLTLGLGLALISSWGFARVPSLDRRIAPHVRASTREEIKRRSETVTPFPTIERLLAPVIRDGARVLERWGAPTREVERRLRRAGSTRSVEQFRAEQVLWGIAALAAGIGIAVLLAAARGSSPLSLMVLAVAVGVGGVVARDWMLSRAVARRERRIVQELPTVAELLALSVSAGEGALGALERVTSTTVGELSRELGATLAEVRAGSPLLSALHALADRTGVAALRRFADGIATAVERGTPLADVLRAQAQDVRADGRRALMEEGGKREIGMMVPVVFLILPVTVVFAVFPGLAAIRLGS